jgi:hypothetical protein
MIERRDRVSLYLVQGLIYFDYYYHKESGGIIWEPLDNNIPLAILLPYTVKCQHSTMRFNVDLMLYLIL